MPRKAINYNKTIIYKLVRNDDFDNANVYVGSTTDWIRRKNGHKSQCHNENNKAYNLKVYQNIRQNGGWGNWKMIEIEKFPCEDKRQAEAREEWWRCEFNANLNTRRPFITEEQKKEYYRENAEKLKEYQKQYQKQYYDENADKLKEKSKKYHTENAEKLHQKYDCDCAGKYIYYNKSRHFKSKKHQNYIKDNN